MHVHHDHMAAPAVSDLCLGGQVVLCAARSWRAGEDEHRPPPCTLFRCAGIGHEAFAAFIALLGLLDASGSRAPSFRAVTDSALSQDEEGLIAALSALQEGAPWRAQRVVASWAAPSIAPRAVGLMAVAARGLAEAGLFLYGPRQSHTLH